MDISKKVCLKIYDNNSAGTAEGGGHNNTGNEKCNIFTIYITVYLYNSIYITELM